MLVTLLGIVTEVRPVQPEKAEFPMLVTLFGIVTEVAQGLHLTTVLSFISRPSSVLSSTKVAPQLLLSVNVELFMKEL